MLFTMVKNNMKLILRSKYIIVMVIIFPIIVVAALSSAFNALLKDNDELERMTVGYATEKESALDDFLRENEETFKEKKIDLRAYEREDGKNLVRSKDIEVLISEEKDEIKIYTLDKQSISAKVCQYMVKQFYTEYGNTYREMTMVAMGQAVEKEELNITKGKLKGMKLAPAKDYYGVVEIVYFLIVGVILLTAVVQSERKNRISQRYICAPTNSVSLYLAKFIPCVMVSVACTLISWGTTVVMFDVHWGNIWGSLGILGVTTLAAISFGILCFYSVKNLAAAVIILFTIAWGSGFVGGTFETYMFSAVPEKIKACSPLYYANRTLVEYSTMGKSECTLQCVAFMVGIFVICSILGCALMKRRMEVE